MDQASIAETTQLLRAVSAGEPAAVDRLLPVVYEHLRAMAGNYFRGEPGDHTLQPTALVHEAYVRLVRADSLAWKDRAHFMALAANAMRRILADHARARSAAKRGGGWDRVSLDEAVNPPGDSFVDVVVLDAVLKELADLDERKHRIVELRFFGGLTVEEIAAVIDVSKTTVETEWRTARAWLKSELERRQP